MLCTALSARRWARYEPPEVPIFGTIGRVRGNAPVAGTSIETEQTAIIGTGDPTEMIALPTVVAPPPPESPTEAVPTQPVPTQPVPTQPVPTQPVPTQPVPTQRVPVASGSGDAPTAMIAAPAMAEPETAANEPTTTAAPSADEPTAIIAETPTAEDEPTVAVDGLPLAPDEQDADGADDSAGSAASAADVEETTAVAVSGAPEGEVEADDQATAASAVEEPTETASLDGDEHAQTAEGAVSDGEPTVVMGALAVDEAVGEAVDESGEPTPATDEPAAEATTEDKPSTAVGTLPHEDESAEQAPAADATAEDEPTVTIDTPPSEDEPSEPAPARPADEAAADVRSDDGSTAGESENESAPASDVDEPDASTEKSTTEVEGEAAASSVTSNTAEPAPTAYDEITEPIARRAHDVAGPVGRDADEAVTAQQDEPPGREDDDAEATPQRDDEIAETVGPSAPAAEPARHAPARSNDPFFAPVSSVIEEDEPRRHRSFGCPQPMRARMTARPGRVSPLATSTSAARRG